MDSESKVIVLYDQLLEVGDERTQGNNKPELRQQAILAEVRDLASQVIETTEAASVETLSQVHHPSYVRFLADAYVSAQKAEDKDWYRDDQLVPYNICCADLKKRLKIARTQDVYKQAGLFAEDQMSPIRATTFAQAARSVSNSIAAAHLALTSPPGSVVYALNASPGHHASEARYAGYCFFNNGAFVARELRERNPGRVIPILDLDYHAGNGTQDLFYKSADFLTLSLHGDPVHDYPNYCGFEDERGADGTSGFNANYCLKPRASAAEYLETLDRALDYIEWICGVPPYLVVAFGADTYKDDPASLRSYPSNKGGMTLDIPDYYEIGQKIRDEYPNTVIVVTQEGGYHLAAVGQIVAAFIRGLSSPGTTRPSDSSPPDS